MKIQGISRLNSKAYRANLLVATIPRGVNAIASTITGVGQVIKERKPEVRIVAIDDPIELDVTSLNLWALS